MPGEVDFRAGSVLHKMGEVVGVYDGDERVTAAGRAVVEGDNGLAAARDLDAAGQDRTTFDHSVAGNV